VSSHSAISETRGAYDPTTVEAKWQAIWREQRTYDAPSPAAERADASVFVAPLQSSSALTFDQVRLCVLADVAARYRRGRGDAVLHALGLEDLAPARAALERLGLSVEWPRAFRFNDSAVRRWTQWLFLALRERGLVEQESPAGPWMLRLSRYHDDNHRELAGLERWNERARTWQETALAPLHGVELRAEGIDGTPLPVFTRHGDAVAKATLIVLSPSHPDIDRWARSAELRTRLTALRAGAGARGAVATGLFAWVPGPDRLLPVGISREVDELIGASALLVIPKASPVDDALAAQFAGVAQATYEYRGRRSKPQPVTRCLAPDRAISATGEQGVAIPLVDCAACGTVAVPEEQLPIPAGPDAAPHPCPRCGAPARRHPGALDGFLTTCVSWLLLAGDRGAATLGGEESERWIAESTLIAGAGAADAVLGMRTIAKVLQEDGHVARTEPFRRVVVVETTACALGATTPDELVKTAGADAMRLAILDTAAGKTLTFNGESLVHDTRLLDRLWTFAATRIGRGDGAGLTAPRRRDTPQLRRLDRWCDVATAKITDNFDALDLHRATRNVQILLERITSFDAAAGAEDDPDGTAVAAALVLLTKLLSPLAPHIAEELWERSGQPGTVGDAPWPLARAAAPEQG
jgi:leucyl-tRNA synthetase